MVLLLVEDVVTVVRCWVDHPSFK